MASEVLSEFRGLLFLPEPPELTELSTEAIHIFLRQRERYLLRFSDAVGQESNFKSVPLVLSVDFDLLDSLIELDTFQGVARRTQLEDEVLLRWLRTQEEPYLFSLKFHELETLVQETVRMRVKEPNPKLRVLSLFVDYIAFLRSKKLETLITTNPSVAVGHICALLHPHTLRREIEIGLEVQMENHSMKNDWKEFYKYVLQKAVEYDRRHHIGVGIKRNDG